MANREPRTNKTREKAQRKTTWQRPSALPDPDPQSGVEIVGCNTRLAHQTTKMSLLVFVKDGACSCI